MSEWVWRRDSDPRPRFVVQGPMAGYEVAREFGRLFPEDAAAMVRERGGGVRSIRWAEVPRLDLKAGDSLELPGIPVAGGPLLYVMDRLLADDGCPWDRQQTSTSLMRYLLDESYEACEALVAEDWPAFEDELGDLLLQVVFHGALLADSSFDAIVSRQVDKLVRRHPHVFAGETAISSDAVRDRWEALKAKDPPRTRRAEWIYPALVMAKRAGKEGPVPSSRVFAEVLAALEVYLEESPGKIEEILADAAWAVAEAGRRRHRDTEWALWQRLVAARKTGQPQK